MRRVIRWLFRRQRKTLSPCPCCGYQTLDLAVNRLPSSPGSYLICPICCWEDDPCQFEDPDLAEGANQVSLRAAQRHFQECGASDRKCLGSVRPPGTEEKRDPSWKPLKET